MRLYVSQSQFRSALSAHGERTAVSNALSLAATVVCKLTGPTYISTMDNPFLSKTQYHDRAEIISRHIDMYFDGAEVTVFHEIPTIDFHLDVFYIKLADSNFNVLLTAGMSSMEMNVAEIDGKSDQYKFSEVMALVPEDIDFGKMYPSGTRFDWIMGMIKQVAKFPHHHDTWVGIGHTFQATEEMEPYSSDTSFCGCLVLPTVTFPKEFATIECDEGCINIYSLFPLYREELQYKLQHGFSEFTQFLADNNAKEILDLNRINYLTNPKQNNSGFIDKLKGLFGS